MKFPQVLILAALGGAVLAKADGTTAAVAPVVAAPDDAWSFPASIYVSGGYASDYIFRGRNFGSNLGEGRAELAFPVGESASFSVGGKYATADGYEEAQGFASFQQSIGSMTTALGYRYYGLDADRQEVGLMLGTVLAGLDLSVAYFYDVEYSGHFVEFMGQRTWQMFERMALRAGAGVSASADYWYGDSGLNNAVFRLDLPVTLREAVTLTPWVSASLPMEAIDSFEDETVFGGVNLLFSF